MDPKLQHILDNFDTQGQVFVVGNRNTIKLFNYNGLTINVKSFKEPNFLFGFIYKYFRKSKAKRSYEFAKILESKNIGTPKPIAFYEDFNWFQIKKSFYVSEHLTPDFIIRDMYEREFEDFENILIQFTRFCFKLHENGIEFLDHSPGNTLIKEVEKGKYEFYLVDLNRMNFHENMDFDTRMKNFNRITPAEHWVKIMSAEYARLYGKTYEEVFALMWKYNQKFQQKAINKQKFKKRLGL